MNEQARYALIGAFVLFGILAGLWFVIWMGEGLKRGAKDYAVYFDESVIGLLPKAPVTFNGVTVGSVDTMTIPVGNAKKVKVVLTIDAGTPVNQSTIAQLDTMGLTGVSFVELTATKKDAPPLQVQPGEKLPVIPSKVSFLGALTDHATELSNNLVAVTQNINQLLNKKNQQAIAETLQNIAKTTAKLSPAIKHFNRTLDSLDRAGHSVVEAALLKDIYFITAITKPSEPANITSHFSDDETVDCVSSMVKETLQTLKQHPAMLVRGKYTNFRSENNYEFKATQKANFFC